MAIRYWVGGTGDWEDAENHWASESGGTPNINNFPNWEGTDDVVIDTNSGFENGGQITHTNGSTVCNNLTSITGHNYIFLEQQTSLILFGSLTLESGITFNPWFTQIQALSGNYTINTAGINIPDFIINQGLINSTATYTLQSNLLIEYTFECDGGTFDANGYDITAKWFYFWGDIGHDPILHLGSGIWTQTGSDSGMGGTWFIDQYNGHPVTIIAETSTLKFTNQSEDIKTIHLGSKTYNKVWLSGLGTFIIKGSNTINELKIDNSPNIILFSEGTHQHISILNALGTEGNLITFNSEDLMTQFTLYITTGIVSCDYLNLFNSEVSGGATFYAGSHSVNGGNNTGWLFEDVPPISTRYWIGGSGNWTDTNHWSISNGGNGGANIPTFSDDVFITPLSGFDNGGNINNITAELHNFTCNSGHNFILNGIFMSVFGSLILENGIIWNEPELDFYVSEPETITTNGVVLKRIVSDSSGSLTLQDNLTTTDEVYFASGTFDANDHNITAKNFVFDPYTFADSDIYMGSGIWEVTGTGTLFKINESSHKVNLYSETSTFKITGEDGNDKVIYFDTPTMGTDKSLNNFWIASSVHTTFWFWCGLTFNDFKVDNSHSLNFQAINGYNSTPLITNINTFSVLGTAGNLITFNSDDDINQFTFSKTSGVVSCDYLNLKNSNATSFILDQTQSIDETTGGSYLGRIGNPRVAQIFTPSVITPITRIQTRISKAGNPTDGLIMTIYTDGLTEPATEVGVSAEITEDLIGENEGSICNFDFTNMPNSIPNAKYWYVLSRTGELNDTDYFMAKEVWRENEYYSGGGFWMEENGVWYDISEQNGGFYKLFFKEYYTSTAIWYAGANSIDSGGNSGWKFEAPPISINQHIYPSPFLKIGITDKFTIYHFKRTGEKETYNEEPYASELECQVTPASPDLLSLYPDVAVGQLFDIFSFANDITIETGDKFISELNGKEYIVKGIPAVYDIPKMGIYFVRITGISLKEL